jgi:hypothetical protein
MTLDIVNHQQKPYELTMHCTQTIDNATNQDLNLQIPAWLGLPKPLKIKIPSSNS